MGNGHETTYNQNGNYVWKKWAFYFQTMSAKLTFGPKVDRATNTYLILVGNASNGGSVKNSRERNLLTI